MTLGLEARPGSCIIAGSPMCIGFGLVFALLAYLTGSGGLVLLPVPIGGLIAAQTIPAVRLLRQTSAPSREAAFQASRGA